jgi:hypothetical protein
MSVCDYDLGNDCFQPSTLKTKAVEDAERR